MSDTANSQALPFQMTAKRKTILARYQADCFTAPQMLPSLRASVLQKRINTNLRLVRYLRRVSMLIDWPDDLDSLLFALYDADGTMLELRGRKEALEWANNAGICVGTRWSLNESGINAVSIGLKEGCGFYTVGEENACAALRTSAICFSPLTMESLEPPYGPVNYGGVAVIAKAPRPQHFQTIASLLSHDLKLNMQFADVAYGLYTRTGLGVLVADTQIVSGQVIATYVNDTLFRMLGVQPTDIYFKPINQLIDPLPENPKFWAAFTRQQPMENESITLSIMGKKVDCILTAQILNQSGLDVRSVNFFFDTPQNISAKVSARMGNSAVRTFSDIVGQAPAIKAAIQRGRILAQPDSNIMLLGESGVGKDIFAQAIHNSSRRRNKPFIAVNCGALPRELIASELFGYVGGAFTGANRQGNIGKFELANGGTIFLDEIGELPLDLQATLLRVVEQKQLTRLGGTKTVDIDVKIISATNVDIPSLIRQKRFRADLYFRLSTMSLFIPPLRERGNDIILLAEHFIKMLAERIGEGKTKQLSDDAKKFLLQQRWVGNVRELENVIESVVYLYPDEVIEARHIEENLSSMNHTPCPSDSAEDAHPDASDPQALLLELPWNGSSQELQGLIDTIIARYPASVVRATPLHRTHQESGLPLLKNRNNRKISKDELLEAAAACGNVRSDMARYLGISRATLYRYIDRYGL